MIKLCAFVVSILLFAQLGWAAQQANIFVYHRFGDSRYPSTNIDLRVFAAQLQYLQQNEYTVLYASDIVSRLKSGQPLPQRCVALTVDDGYTSFLTGAMPLLRQYGYPVTLFVSSDSVGAGSYLNWQQLRQLQEEGVEIGNHSASHPYFVTRQSRDPQHWRAQAKHDIQRAQQAFKKHLGTTPQLFAYPYGEYSPELETLLQEIGFAAAFAQQSGVVDPSINFPFSIPRFPMGGSYATAAGFKNKVNMRHLPIELISTASPVVIQDPPVMLFTVHGKDVNIASLRCYIQGQDAVAVQQDDDGNFKVCALAPLAGRRNKYTITAQSHDGKSWYWFSHLWVHP